MINELTLEEFTKLYDELRTLSLELTAEDHGLSDEEIRAKLQRINEIDELVESRRPKD